MDLSKTIIAKSDQLNADDLITGPRTFTVVDVRPGSEEQPVSIVLAEWPSNRPFKPSKTVQRILAYCWGAETDDWPKDARMTLYRDEKVKWAGEEVGGIRVSHLSHINGQQKIALQESKHKKSLHTIQPLREAAPKQAAPAEPTADEVAACVDLAALHDLWKRATSEERREQIRQRKADLENEPGVDEGEQ